MKRLCDYGICRRKAVRIVETATEKRPACPKHAGYIGAEAPKKGGK